MWRTPVLLVVTLLLLGSASAERSDRGDVSFEEILCGDLGGGGGLSRGSSAHERLAARSGQHAVDKD